MGKTISVAKHRPSSLAMLALVSLIVGVASGLLGAIFRLTLEQAAFHQWDVEASGCFCTAGHRLHKWRNVFQALHYAATHAPG